MYPLFGHTLTSLYPSIIQSLTRPSQVRRTANSDWTKIEQTMNVASYPLVVDSSWTLHYNIATYAHAHDFSTCWENIDSKVGKLKGRHGVMDKEWDACWESEVKWSQDVGKLLVWVINGENGDNPWEFCGENIDLLPTFTLSHKGCPAPSLVRSNVPNSTRAFHDDVMTDLIRPKSLIANSVSWTLRTLNFGVDKTKFVNGPSKNPAKTGARIFYSLRRGRSAYAYPPPPLLQGYHQGLERGCKESFLHLWAHL